MSNFAVPNSSVQADLSTLKSRNVCVGWMRATLWLHHLVISLGCHWEIQWETPENGGASQIMERRGKGPLPDLMNPHESS